jgi:hypothetical protein
VPEDDTHTHIDISQTATGGLKGTTEVRVLNWQERTHSDHLFGDLKGKSRWIDLSPEDTPDEFLRDGWEPSQKAGPNGEGFIQSFVVNESKGWTADQIWGFAVIEGQRYHVRRVVVIKGKEVVKVRLVYNWKG